MRRLLRSVLVGIGLGCAAACLAQFRPLPLGPTTVPKETNIMTRATGTFEVKMAPLTDAFAKSAGIASMSIDKQFHGDLEATSKGEMLSAGDYAKGNAGYVAIEQVTGTLGGHTGSFALQHSGTMTDGRPELSVTVVPGSGTGQLAGISGSMKIKIENGKHSYELEYSLPQTQ